MTDALLQRFTSVHQQVSCELIGLSFDPMPEKGVVLHPEVVPRMQKAVPYGMGYHPPTPWRIKALCHPDGAVDLHLLEDAERPCPHLQPQVVGHAFRIHLAA